MYKCIDYRMICLTDDYGNFRYRPGTSDIARAHDMIEDGYIPVGSVFFIGNCAYQIFCLYDNGVFDNDC